MDQRLGNEPQINSNPTFIMRAAFIRETGDPSAIEFGDLPEPTVDRDQVLIRNHAVSVNPIDTYVRGGMVAFELPIPFMPGCDAAGVVEKVGSDVTHVKPGDRVWCTNQGLLGVQGTFAEKIAVKSDWVYTLPDNVSFAEAAASALVAVTAHLGLFREANLQPGETVLVIGGTGGVGSMVLQMAKAVGARVLATGGSPEKCQRILDLGADVAIDYSAESILDGVKREAPEGINVFWETRREPDFDTAIELMAGRGRMVVMAGRDARPEFPVGPFYVKECSVHGFVMFKASADEMRACATQVNQWMSEGKLKANISKTLPLQEAAEAHRLQEQATLEGSGGLAGKIVLTID